MTEAPESWGRPWRAARAAWEAAARGEGDRRLALMEAIDGLEATLRRWLRDDADAPLALRLQALAPDEVPADRLLAELRQRGRLSLELAAAIHDLLRAREVLRAQVDVDPRTVDRLVAQIGHVIGDLEARLSARASATAAEEGPTVRDAETDVHPVPPPGRSRRGWTVAVGAVGVLLVLVLGWLVARDAGRADRERAIAALRSGDYAAAAAALERYVARHPEEVDSWLALARAYRRLRQPERAAEALRRAAALDPSDPGVQRELGLWLLERGHYDRAALRFEAALARDSSDVAAWAGLLQALRRAGRTDDARRRWAAAPPEVRQALGGP